MKESVERIICYAVCYASYFINLGVDSNLVDIRYVRAIYNLLFELNFQGVYLFAWLWELFVRACFMSPSCGSVAWWKLLKTNSRSTALRQVHFPTCLLSLTPLRLFSHGYATSILTSHVYPTFPSIWNFCLIQYSTVNCDKGQAW